MSYIYNWWDVIFFLVLSIIHIGSWIERKKALDATPLNGSGQRELGATSMANAGVAGITAVSILISASLLIVQIAFEHTSEFPHQALEYIFRASAWFLLSLLFGLYLIYLIPMLSPKHNVARKLATGIPFGLQLIALLIGVIWFVRGIYFVVYNCR